MKELTKAQEEILKAIWKTKEGAVSDIIQNLSFPKPVYNTVATVVKVLEKKGYVTHKTYGKTNVYSPVISKTEYTRHIAKNTVKGLFNGSLNQFVSNFLRNKDMSIQEMEELKELIEQEIKNKKN